MKNSVIILLVAFIFSLYGLGVNALAKTGCCIKDSCSCIAGSCCIKGKCACKAGDCCKGERCACGQQDGCKTCQC
jgi:hypothetical protein